jgi:hypothetical protein
VSGFSVSKTDDGWGNPAEYVDDVYTLSNETTNLGGDISLPVYINSHGTHALAWMERRLGRQSGKYFMQQHI